jgi:hypothetical protein
MAIVDPPEPPERPPTATPISAYGNNAAAACPCGRIIVVRSMNREGTGEWRCDCQRRYKGFPHDGHRITHILVWEIENRTAVASYRVRVEEELHQAQ